MEIKISDALLTIVTADYPKGVFKVTFTVGLEAVSELTRLRLGNLSAGDAPVVVTIKPDSWQPELPLEEETP